jgi:hypothetical protein
MIDNTLKESGAKLSFTSENFDRNNYSAVAAAARLRDVKLIRQTYAIKEELYANSAIFSEDPNLAFSGEPRELHFEADEGVLLGSYAWSVSIKVGRKQVLSQKAEFFLAYSSLNGKDPAYCSLYFKKISRFTSYPYFRALFATNVMNSGLVLPPLPSLTDRVD